MASGWLDDRQRDGGIDRVPLPDEVEGQLWLCGKQAIAPSRFNDGNGPWSIVVCLCERHELADRYPDYLAWLDRPDTSAIHRPIPDLHALPSGEMIVFADELVGLLRAGERLLVHCAAGIGRTGTTAVCVLVRLGSSMADALRTVGDARPMAGPEVGAQVDVVHAVASAS